MLDEYKEIYKQRADLLPGWDKISKSDLCRKYIEVKDIDEQLADSYLSAIIYKSWSIAVHNYYSQKGREVTEIECYNNLVDSVMCVLENHVWTDKDNKLYDDPNGPEKALNVVINSRWFNIITYNNRQKRVLNKNTLSVDYLQEISSPLQSFKTYDEFNDGVISKKVSELFDKSDYFKAFVLDAIIHCDVFKYDEDKNTNQFCFKKMRKHLRNLYTNNYIATFSELYELDLEEVKSASSLIVCLGQNRMDSLLTDTVSYFRSDKDFIKYLRDNNAN